MKTAACHTFWLWAEGAWAWTSVGAAVTETGTIGRGWETVTGNPVLISFVWIEVEKKLDRSSVWVERSQLWYRRMAIEMVVPAFLIKSAASRWVISEQDRPLILTKTSPRRRSLPTATCHALYWLFCSPSLNLIYSINRRNGKTQRRRDYWFASFRL